MATQSGILAWENAMSRGALTATIHGAAKNQKRLSTHTQRTETTREAGTWR